MNATERWFVTKYNLRCSGKSDSFRTALIMGVASIYTAGKCRSLHWRVLGMDATGCPSWSRETDSVNSHASHSTIKGIASSMWLNDATSTSFFTAFSVSVRRGNCFTFTNYPIPQ